MKTLKELLEQRAKLVADLDKIAKADDITDEQRAEFDKIEAQIEALDGDITRAKKLEQRRSEAAAQVPADDENGQSDAAAGQTRSQNPFGDRPTIAAAPAEQRNLANEFGMFVRSYAAAQCEQRDGKQVHPSQFAKRTYGDNHPVVANLERAQTASENSGGGFLITPNYMPEIIKLFGPNTIVRRNARSVPGNATYFKGKTGASVGYVGENEQGEVTGVTFGSMTMQEKDISAILPISKKLLRNTGYNVEAYCRDELVRASAEFEDLKFLYGTGVGKEVKGYYHSILSDNVFSAANKTAPTRAEVVTELHKVMKAFLSADVPMNGTNPRWFMNPLVVLYLSEVYQGDVKAFPTLDGPNPTLLGYPVDTSTQITGPAGAGGDIFFGCHDYAMVADTVTMSLSTSDQASFKDAAGNTVNMWAMGMLGIKLDMSHDFGFRYDQAFARIGAVKWGQ